MTGKWLNLKVGDLVLNRLYGYVYIVIKITKDDVWIRHTNAGPEIMDMFKIRKYIKYNYLPANFEYHKKVK